MGSRLDDLFNTIAEKDVTIDGITIDVNPIRIKSDEDITRYKQKSQQYDREKLSATNNLRFRAADDIATEQKQIIAEAKANGTYLKAPKGKPTNLNEKQWAQVRTKAFKKWFGDWEKAARIDKLRESKLVEIVFNNEYDLNRDSAKRWMKDNLRGEYINEDTRERISVRKDGVQKVTSHSMGNDAHLISLVGIPALIKNSVFIEERPNEKDNGNYDSYRYYVCGAKINGDDYTVKITVGVKGGSKYYDHALTQIEKGVLIDNIDALSTTFDNNQNTRLDFKDTKLLSIPQTNSSKIVDENGEPKVVWHQTNATEYVNVDTCEVVSVTKVGSNKVTSHGERDEAHLKSIIAIPSLIENSIFIEEQKNEKDNDRYDSYRYYVCGAKIDGEDYTVKVVIGVKGDSKYYDHRLTQIEKGTLIDNLNGMANPVAENQNANNSIGKDSKLISILQTNSSKIVDENGEPMPLKHRTFDEFNVFDKEKIGSNTDSGAFGTGFYFAKRDYILYGNKTMEVFVNMKKPLRLDNSNAYEVKSKFFKDGVSNQDAAQAMTEWSVSQGYDGVIWDDAPYDYEAVVYEPNRIKSAETVTYDDNGNVIPLSERFNDNKNDLRFRIFNENQRIFVSNAERAVETRLLHSNGKP